MLNRLIIISLLCLSCDFVSARAIKLSQRYDDERAIAREFDNLYKELNAVKFVVFSSTPVLVATGTVTIQEGQPIFFSTGAVGILYIRTGNQLFYKEFNKQ